jgi:hypothetical protein
MCAQNYASCCRLLIGFWRLWLCAPKHSGRNYLLLKMQTSATVVPKDVVEATGLHPNDCREMLRRFARPQVQRVLIFTRLSAPRHSCGTACGFASKYKYFGGSKLVPGTSSRSRSCNLWWRKLVPKLICFWVGVHGNRRPDGKNGWVFKFQTDEDFAARFPVGATLSHCHTVTLSRCHAVTCTARVHYL